MQPNRKKMYKTNVREKYNKLEIKYKQKIIMMEKEKKCAGETKIV